MSGAVRGAGHFLLLALQAAMLAAALGVGGPAVADEPDEAAPKTETIFGKLRVELDVAVNAGLPAGTELSVSQSIRVADDVFDHVSTLVGTATVAAGKARYAVVVPYRWEVASRSGAIDVLVSVAAAHGDGSAFVSFARSLPVPHDGAVTRVVFAGSI